MPAYNAAKTLVECYHALPLDVVDQVVLVDDCSQDNTVEVARRLPITVVTHTRNLGYGANQKTCYAEAVKLGGDIAVMVHPDHQYDPKFIPEMIRILVDEDQVGAVFGSRMMVRADARAGGMPYWKYWANIFLTKICNLILGTNFTEFHSGFRAYKTKVFKEIDINKNSDDFVFDTQIIIQLIDKKILIKEIAISTRYFPEASQISLLPSIKYGLSIIFSLILYVTGLKKY